MSKSHTSPPKKIYVVWVGYKPGVYESWEACRSQTDGYPSAKFKSFSDRDFAVSAFQEGYTSFMTGHAPSRGPGHAPTGTYLTVDASFNGVGITEWRGVLVTDEGVHQVFRSPAYIGGSSNIGEYCALARGLKYLRDNRLDLPLYTDSMVAQSWLKKKAHRSNVEISPTLKALLLAADNYIKSIDWPIDVRDWKSSVWGEIPADYGRKGSKGIPRAERMVA